MGGVRVGVGGGRSRKWNRRRWRENSHLNMWEKYPSYEEYEYEYEYEREREE
jgi:hypothetical protein